MELFTILDISEYAKFSPSKVRQLTARPDFPKAIRVPNTHPRWDAEEVREWFAAWKDAA